MLSLSSVARLRRFARSQCDARDDDFSGDLGSGEIEFDLKSLCDFACERRSGLTTPDPSESPIRMIRS
jgi:hypothetical protein